MTQESDIAQEKPGAIVLCVEDEHGGQVGAIAVTNDAHLSVRSIVGEFNGCLEELSEEFEVLDAPEVVDGVTDAWLKSGFEAFDPVSVFYDPSTGTSVRKLVKYLAGRLDSKPVGYVRFDVGRVSEIKARLEDVVPSKVLEPTQRKRKGSGFS